jgi:hypothetical protein
MKKSQETILQFHHESEALVKKYQEKIGLERVHYALIMLSAKRLFDLAPRHRMALEAIRVAVEEGIKWHVEEKERNHE